MTTFFFNSSRLSQQRRRFRPHGPSTYSLVSPASSPHPSLKPLRDPLDAFLSRASCLDITTSCLIITNRTPFATETPLHIFSPSLFRDPAFPDALITFCEQQAVKPYKIWFESFVGQLFSLKFQIFSLKSRLTHKHLLETSVSYPTFKHRPRIDFLYNQLFSSLASEKQAFLISSRGRLLRYLFLGLYCFAYIPFLRREVILLNSVFTR